jgi:hypothetical protein
MSPNVKAGNRVRKKVAELLLDTENYRLPESTVRDSQISLLKALDRDFDLEVIGKSLSDNGYFEEEPLAIIPSKDEPNQFIVVEGNRRLAALKLLTEPMLREHSGSPDDWDAMAKKMGFDVTSVPCVQYEHREDVTAFLGFRHITGAKKWDPESKARFIDSLVTGKADDFRIIAREIGSKPQVVRRYYVALRILKQARDKFGIDTSRMEEKFGVFYRALSTPSIPLHFGLNLDRSPSELKWPVAENKASALEEIIGFIHGTEELRPVIEDSRQLTSLGEILENKIAYDHLRRTRKLSEALELTGGTERRLLDNLYYARYYMDQAARDIHHFKEKAEVGIAVKEISQSVEALLGTFPEARIQK